MAAIKGNGKLVPMESHVFNYYQWLEVDPTSSLDVLEAALQTRRKAARSLRKQDPTASSAEMALVREAIDIFSAEESRAEYDTQLNGEYSASSNASNGQTSATSPAKLPDYYKKLQLSPDAPLEIVQKRIRALNAHYKRLLEANSPKAAAIGKLRSGLVVTFASAETRIEYDREMGFVPPAALPPLPGDNQETAPDAAGETVPTVDLPVVVDEENNARAPTTSSSAEQATSLPDNPPNTPRGVTEPVVSNGDAPSTSQDKQFVPSEFEGMIDFYEWLQVEPDVSLEKLKDQLRAKRRLVKQLRTNKPVEAAEVKDLEGRAAVVFKDENTREAYDAKLKAWAEHKIASEPRADEDYYRIIGLELVATVEMIERRLNALAREDDPPAGLDVIRETLLTPEKKQAYDQQLIAKRAYDNEKAKRPPVPLMIQDNAINSMYELEQYADENPDEVLFHITDGEVSAWLEWAHGRRNEAAKVAEYGIRMQTTRVPYMDLDALFRQYNSGRPLVLYEPNKKPGEGDHPAIHRFEDLVAVAEEHPKHAHLHAEYILDWLGIIGQEALVDEVANIEPYLNINVQLERLLYHVEPSLPPPKAVIVGLEDNILDFDTVGRLSSPKRKFTIKHKGRGYLYGQLKGDSAWFSINMTEFSGKETDIEIQLIGAEMPVGDAVNGVLLIRLCDGRASMIKIPVRAYRETAAQNIQRYFKQLRDAFISVIQRIRPGKDKQEVRTGS
jgi:hypothetical protein